MKKLPIGIQDIDKILSSGEYLYVDKTHFAQQLIEAGPPHYFISRPRRFGKSLFVSTLEKILRGDKAFFQGCAIHESLYAWAPHCVLHFDFSQIPNESPGALESGLQTILHRMAKAHGVQIEGNLAQLLLSDLIEKLGRDNKVAVLIDEYDQPLINNLDDLTLARANRKLLKNFFATLKGLDKYIMFTFVTGISKFSQASLFSGPNYLTDITMDSRYATLFGYTEEELKQAFAEHMYAINKPNVLNEVREWYNGYRFSKSETRVYNPFSTLNYMEKGETKSYWYRTGTPSFLVDQVRKHPQNLSPLSGTTAAETTLMDITSLENIDLTALMYQTGYLTIDSYEADDFCRLRFPNTEVKKAFLDTLIKAFGSGNIASSVVYSEALENHQLLPLIDAIKALFAGFPYQLFARAHESTYHLAFVSALRGMGLNVRAEECTNVGRIDFIVELSDTLYIFELKLDASAHEALDQILSKRYFDKYLNAKKSIGIVGINFSSKERNIAEWKAQLLSSTSSTKTFDLIPTS